MDTCSASGIAEFHSTLTLVCCVIKVDIFNPTKLFVLHAYTNNFISLTNSSLTPFSKERRNTGRWKASGKASRTLRNRGFPNGERPKSSSVSHMISHVIVTWLWLMSRDSLDKDVLRTDREVDMFRDSKCHRYAIMTSAWHHYLLTWFITWLVTWLITL